MFYGVSDKESYLIRQLQHKEQTWL